MLDRRTFLRTSAIGSAALVTGCECAERCGTATASFPTAAPGRVTARTLKMVTSWPKDFPGTGDAAEAVAKLITAMSGGAINVEVYSAGELVGAFDAFDAVSGGSADLYHSVEYYWTGKSQAFPYFGAVPFGMTATEQMAWLEADGGQALWDELAAPFNIKPLPAGNTGHQMGGWYKREVNSLDDLRGLKIRMPGIGGEVMQRAGAAAVNIPGGELYQALQSGAIDATEWIGPWNDLAFGFYREAKYYYWPGFHEPGAQLSLGLNLSLWNDLSPAEQAIISSAARAANHINLGQFTAQNARALRVLIEEHKVELRRMPQDVMTALAGHTRDVLTEIAASSDIAGRIHTSYFDALRRYSAWNAVADEAYLAARRLAMAP